MHGVMEAIYYGVPMVGMPVFIDQVDVLARIEQKRIGVGLDKWASSNEIRFAVDIWIIHYHRKLPCADCINY